MAPIVATLLANGINILGNAIMAKGKEVVEDKLGVKIPDSPTKEDLITLRALEVKHEETLLSFVLEDKKLDIENTKDARDMNARVQESANSSKLAKEAAYYLDFTIVGATLLMAYTILWSSVPEANKELFYLAFGSLLTLCGTIVNFHRGSTTNSKEKDNTISALSRGVK